jgi:hypothetical protein
VVTADDHLVFESVHGDAVTTPLGWVERVGGPQMLLDMLEQPVEACGIDSWRVIVRTVRTGGCLLDAEIGAEHRMDLEVLDRGEIEVLDLVRAEERAVTRGAGIDVTDGLRGEEPHLPQDLDEGVRIAVREP